MTNSPESSELHVFDVTRRESVMGHIRVIVGESKADAQSKMSDVGLTSQFFRNYESLSEEEIQEILDTDEYDDVLLPFLDGESHYDGVDYLGELEDAFPEVISRLSTGIATSCVIQPPEAKDRLDAEYAQRIEDALNNSETI